MSTIKNMIDNTIILKSKYSFTFFQLTTWILLLNFSFSSTNLIKRVYCFQPFIKKVSTAFQFFQLRQQFRPFLFKLVDFLFLGNQVQGTLKPDFFNHGQEVKRIPGTKNPIPLNRQGNAVFFHLSHKRSSAFGMNTSPNPAARKRSAPPITTVPC